MTLSIEELKEKREQAETAKVCGGMFAISGEQALVMIDELIARRVADKPAINAMLKAPDPIFTALQPPAAQEGWQMVPIEPTEDMVIDGFESKPSKFFSPSDVWEAYDAMSGCQQAAHRAKLCWAAMLAAAPKPIEGATSFDAKRLIATEPSSLIPPDWLSRLINTMNDWVFHDDQVVYRPEFMDVMTLLDEASTAMGKPAGNDELIKIANHISSAKEGLPDGWKDWAEELESDIRKLSASGIAKNGSD